MSHEPTVLLVGVPERASEFGRALKQVGRPAAAVTMEELPTALTAVTPLAVVAPAEHVSAILEVVKAAKFPHEIPLFALQNPTQGSMRPPLPGVTACVPSDIDGGIFSLRLQQALQQSPAPRPRQETVVGLGAFSRPMAMPSAPAGVMPVLTGAPTASSAVPPTAPANVPAPPTAGATPAVPTSAGAPVPPTSSPSSPLASSGPTSTRPAPTAPSSRPAPAPTASSGPSVPWEDPSPWEEPPTSASGSSKARQSSGVISSAPPLPPDLTPPPPGARATPSTDPGLGSRPDPSVKAAPPSPAAEPRPPAPPIPTADPNIPSNRPVTVNTAVAAMRPPAETDPFAQAARGRSRMLKISMAAAGAVAVLGVGGAVLLGGGKGDADASQPSASAEEAEADKTAATSTATAGEKATAPAGAPAPATPPPEVKAPAAPAAPPASEDELLFKIEGETSLPSCETILKKTPADFASSKKWRAASAWKLARSSLMAGKEDLALSHMCESAFIDPSGQAPGGLVKYYLGRRSIGEAEKWAQKALESARGAPSKRAAQQLVADVLSQQGKMEEARKLWLESFNLTADQTARLTPVCKNFVNSALTAKKGGDSGWAEQLLRRAAAFEPDNATTAALLASVLLQNEQRNLAERWAKKALAKDSGSEMAQTVLSQLGK